MKLAARSVLLGFILSPFSLVHSAPMVELFTSQGCYSCPPADDFLADLIEENPDVVALEFHVDYWDDLNYGSAGTWKDPFSDATYTKRQRVYNQRDLQGRRGVYTPQMVINGHTAQVGTSRGAVNRALGVAVPPLDIVAKQNGNDIAISVEGNHKRKARIWLAVFDRNNVTEVVRGENKGKTMRNHHVVRELTPVADWHNVGTTASIEVPALAQNNTGCAVFVQERDNGPILAASYCKP